MLSNCITKIVKFLLRAKLSNENKMEIWNSFLENVKALPIREVIEVKEGTMFVVGKPVDMEQALALRESAKSMIRNHARRLVLEQVSWQAVNIGFKQGTSPEQILFAKAAVWFSQEEDKLYRLLAQEESPDLPGLEDL